MSVFLSIFVSTVSAAGSKDRIALYNDLMRKGSVSQIREQLWKDNSFIYSVDGVTADNLLMQALALGRDIDVIKTLLYSRISPTDKNNEGQTAVMYACAYAKDENVILEVITSGAITDSAVRRRLLRKDRNGYSAVDYAYAVNAPVGPNAIRRFLTEEIIVQYEGINSTPDEQVVVEKKPVIASVEEYVPEEPPPQEETPAAPQDENTMIFPTAIISSTLTYDGPKDVDSSLVTDDPVPVVVDQRPFDLIADSAHIEDQSAARINQSSSHTYLYDGIEFSGMNETSPTDKLMFIQNADEPNDRGQTKLMQAVVAGDMQLVANLLFSGAQVDEQDDEGWTALMYAARYQNDSRITQSLLAAGADVTIKNDYGLTALALASTYSKNENIISLLLAPYKYTDEDVIQSFVYLITTPTGKSIPHQIRGAELFMNKGVKVNTFWHGKTLLMYAASSSPTTEIISLLLARGARKDVYSSEGKTAFHYAQNNGNLPHDEVYWSLNSND